MFKTLIVDDNETIRLMLNQTLAERFPAMQIAQAGNVASALVQVESLVPDLILLDIKLPDGNGIDLTRRIKQEHPGIMVIIITAYDLPEYRYAATKAGADHVLSKDTLMSTDIPSLVDIIINARKDK